MARMPLFFAAACLVFPVFVPAGEPAAMRLPTPAAARGEGAGKIFVVPVAAGEPERELDPASFRVHLAPAGSRPVEEKGLAAGAWLALPAPEMDLWLEGSQMVSPYTLRVARPAAGSPGQILRVPVAAAGRVAIPVDVEGDLRVELHLWSAGPFRDPAGRLQGDLTRRILLPAPAAGVAMPAGRAVAGIFEPKSRRYLLLSRPFAVTPGETFTVATESEDVFAQLVADIDLGGAPADGARLGLEQFGLEAPPDLSIDSRDRKVAFWYELVPAETSIAASSGDFLLPPWKQQLGGGAIEALQEKLVPWPTLEVELILPAGLNGRQLKLAARAPERYRTFEEVEFTGDFRHTFRRLPLEPLELVLETPLGATLRSLDFSGGEDQRVVWEPELLSLEGTVYYDGEPRRATLSFRSEAQVETDPQGRYRAELLGEVRTIEVRVDGVPGDPHIEILSAPRTTPGRLDIHVPPVLFSVRVIDAATRQGIDAARVEVVNSFGPQQQLRQSVRTDADGQAWIPPVQPGFLELKASAEDYLDARPLRIEVPAKPGRQEFELRLDKIESQAQVELLLPGGRPAALASLALFDVAGEAELWRDMADQAGRVEVPMVAGLLLVTSTESAFLATGWPLDERRLALPPRAEHLLMVQVVDGRSRPVAGAEMALFLDGRYYRRDVLGFLVGAPPFTGPGGEFVADNLPPRAFGLLAFSPLVPAPPAAAATEIRYPWPHLVQLRLAR